MIYELNGKIPRNSPYNEKFEFDNEDELYRYFNNSEYLNKYPRLQEYVIQSALQGLKDSQEASEKYIRIRKGKSIKFIEKGVELPDGWSVSGKEDAK